MDLNARLQEIQNSMFQPIVEDDSLLYHYTDFNGLKGILESNKLRAMSTKVLNDGTERSYAQDVVVEYLTGKLDFQSVSFASELKKYMTLFGGDTFVTCFCEDHDLLSMWRGYASHGGGYCLGFRKTGLNSILGQYGHLAKLYYGSVMPSHISTGLEELVKLYAESDFVSSGAGGMQTLGLAMATLDLIKHNAFHEEKEWRIIQSNVLLQRQVSVRDQLILNIMWICPETKAILTRTNLTSCHS